MRKNFLIFCYYFVFTFLFISSSAAAIVHYYDKNGQIHYVNTDYSKVPMEYMDQVIPQLEELQPPPEEVPEPAPVTVIPEPPISNVSMPQKIELFVTSECEKCRQIETIFAAHRLTFRRYDILLHPYGREMYEKYQGEVPIVVMDDKVYYGNELRKVILFLRELRKAKKL